METTLTPLQHAELDDVIAQIENRPEAGLVTLDPQQRSLARSVVEFLHDAAAAGDTRQLNQTGYFVYGPPGRGKTWLMTQLFETAQFPDEAKRQVHFHDFFRSLQQHLGAKTSTRAAIDATLTELLTGTKLFFFDELHVHDPGSAALLNRLLEAIAHQGIPTLITSNYEPEGLLPDLMFHHVIEPGVKVIREHFNVLTLDGGTDYRRQNTSRESGFASGHWHVVEQGQDREEILRLTGLELPRPEEARDVLEDHRVLKASAIRGNAIWFNFTDLLQTRSVTSDFIELVTTYDTWVLTDVPPMSQADPAARQRFVTLIDVLVDRDIPLTVYSAISREDLVDIADPPPDLFRTVSRLALLGDGSNVG